MIQDTAWSPRFVPSTTATAATSGEAIAGTDTTKFITPSLLPAATSYHAGPVVNGRAPRQGLVFDGTNGASFTEQNTSTSHTVRFVFNSTFDTTGRRYVAWKSASYGMGVSSNSEGRKLFVEGSIFALGNTSLVAGKNYDCVFVYNGSTVTFYLNGVADGTTSAITTNNISRILDTNQSASISGFFIYNRALSAAEVVALYEAGAPSGADYNSASNTAINTVAPTLVGGGTLSGTSATGFTFTGSSATGYVLIPAQSTPALSYAGTKFRVTFTASITTGTVTFSGRGVSAIQNTTAVSAGSNSFIITFSQAMTSNNSCGFEFDSSGTATYAISSLSIQPLGLLLAPDAAQAGGGYVWNDQSGNLAQIVLPSSGVQWNLPSVAGNRIRGTTSTNGNQQLLGASVLLPAECQITHVRARARTGTPTITIGTASGGAQIVASVALSTTWLNCTIALTGGIVSSADDIWVGSNSTDVVETDIAFQPLDF